MDYLKRFMVAPGKKVKLKDIDPGFTDKHENHKEAEQRLSIIKINCVICKNCSMQASSIHS